MADAESNLLLWDYRPIHEQQRHRPYVQRRIHTHSDDKREKKKVLNRKGQFLLITIFQDAAHDAVDSSLTSIFWI